MLWTPKEETMPNTSKTCFSLLFSPPLKLICCIFCWSQIHNVTSKKIIFKHRFLRSWGWWGPTVWWERELNTPHTGKHFQMEKIDKTVANQENIINLTACSWETGTTKPDRKMNCKYHKLEHSKVVHRWHTLVLWPTVTQWKVMKLANPQWRWKINQGDPFLSFGATSKAAVLSNGII